MRPLRACKSFGLFLPKLGPRLSRPFLFAAPDRGAQTIEPLDSRRVTVARFSVAIEQEDALA